MAISNLSTGLSESHFAQQGAFCTNESIDIARNPLLTWFVYVL
jgi:hypothetical protein